MISTTKRGALFLPLALLLCTITPILLSTPKAPSDTSTTQKAKQDDAALADIPTEHDDTQIQRFTANCLITPGSLTVGGTVTFSSLGAGVVQANSSGVLSATDGTDGQLLIGATVGAPAWANLTSSDNTVLITNGANSIDLVAIGGSGGGIVFLDADNSQHAGTAVVTVTGGGVGSIPTSQPVQITMIH